jgi:hypothetical protein
MVVGAFKDSTAGFEGTLRAVSYASVGSLAQIVPFVGGMISTVWTIVLSIIGIVALHKATQGKAAAAVLLPIALCCVCGIVAALVGGAALFSLIAGQQ